MQVTALGTSVVEVSAGGEYTCAITQDDALWCWGDDSVGQLGLGFAGSEEHLPVQVLACP